jgi:hypothetical protein
VPISIRRFVVIAALIASAIGVTAALAARYAFPGRDTVAACIILLTCLLLLLTVWHGALAFLSRGFAGRPTLFDRAPAEPVAALFLLPVTTVLAGLAINFADAGADLLNEWAPESKVSTNLLAFEIAAVAIGSSILVPLIALHNVVEAKQGRGVALFDPTIDDAVFQCALAERWGKLRSAPRRWLASHRIAAIGDETAPAAVAWPTQPAHMPPAHRRSLASTPWVAASAATLSLLTFAAAVEEPLEFLPVPNLTTLAVAYGVTPVSLTVLLMWIFIYRRLLREQAEADLLRLARSSRPAQLPPPPLTLAGRWSLLQQAFGRSSVPRGVQGNQPSSSLPATCPQLTPERHKTTEGSRRSRIMFPQVRDFFHHSP